MFKKICSYICLICIVLSQLQVLQVYAQGQAELNAEKEKGEQTLDAVETVIDAAVENIDTKLGNNTKKKNQLEEKHEEIEAYLDEVQADIASENNSEDIKERVEEAKKVVVLKVVSGITEYEDVEDSIDSEVANTPAEIETALETIQDSLETETGDYSIIVRSSKSIGDVQDLFATFDPEIKIEEMYETDGKNYFEVFLAEDSIFREEMLEDIESGILPERFLGVNIVLPEVFGINSGRLEGENISQTWGIEEYKSYNFIEAYKNTSEKIRVGVVDTGIDYNHPDLKNNVNQRLGKDFVNNDDDAWDDQGHGTHVAGTIAANINGEGIIGVNPYVELVPLKICTKRGFCPSYAVLRALEYAKTEKIDILNMSLGGRGNPSGHAICAGISSVVASGGIIVAASGNSNIDTSRFVPGGCSDAITVAAIDDEGNRAGFSNYGDKVDVAAPGVQVYSSYPMNKGEYKKLSGTSMATPHVVGVISLIQARDPDITASEAKEMLKKYTSPVKTDKSYKTIAAGIHLEELLASYETIPEKVVEKIDEAGVKEESISEEKEEEIKKVEKTEIIKDDASLDTNLVWNADIEKISENNNSDEEKQIGRITTNSIKIDIGDIEEMEINSSELIEYRDEDFETLIEEEEKNYSDTAVASIILDENGNDISSEIEINSDEEKIPVSGIQVPEDFDFENLEVNEIFSENRENTKIYYEEEEVKEYTQEVFIDGAEAGVEINSSEEALEFESHSEVPESQIEDPVLLDENGEEVIFSQDDIIDDIEELELVTHSEEIFIDGAEAGVEINSLEGDEALGDTIEIPEYSEEDITFEDIIGEEISGYDEDAGEGVEINSLGDDVELGELIEISESEMIIEEIEEVEYSEEEIFIDGAEAGVEINSLEGDEALGDTIEIPEYSEEDIIFEDIIGEDISEYDEDTGEGVEINSLDSNSENEFIFDESTLIEIPENEMIIEEIEEETENISDGIEINSFGGNKVKNIYVSVLKNQRILKKLSEAQNYQYSFSNGSNIKFQRGYGFFLVTGKNFGTTKIYAKFNGVHRYTIHVTVVDPKPKTYTHTIIEGQNKKIYLPKGGDLGIYRSGVGISAWDSRKYGGYITVRGSTPGNATLHFKEASGLVKYIVYIKIAPKPPIVKTISMYEGQRMSNYIYGASSYSMSFSRSGYASISRNWKYMYITGKKSGTFKIYLKKNGIHKYTFHVTIKAKPVPKEYTVNIQEGKESRVYLPKKFSYRFFKTGSTTGSAYFYNYGQYGYVKIIGQKSGKISYKIFDQYGIHWYTINANIIALPPVVKILTLYEGQWKNFYEHYYHRPSVSNRGIIQAYYYNRPYFKALKPGTVNLYLKDARGSHKFTYKITVLAKPKPQTQNIKIKVGSATTVHLPENISNYYVHSSGNNIFDKKYQYTTSFYLSTIRPGKHTLTIYDRKTWFKKYIINIEAEVETENISLYKTDTIKAWNHSSYNFKVQNTNVIQYSSGSKGGSIYGKNIGSTQVHVYKGSNLRKIWNVNVQPIPARKTISCTTIAGQSCTLRVPNNGYYYYSNINSNKLDFDTSAKEIEVESSESGSVIIYVRSPIGNYVTHVFQVRFTAPPVVRKTCIIPIGKTCSTYKIRDISDYRIGVSRSGIVQTTSRRVWKNGSRTDIAELVINGTKEGNSEVYLYNGRDHIATIATQVIPAVDDLSITKTSFKLSNGKSTDKITLAGGGGKYGFEYEKESDRDGLYINTSSQSDSSGYVILKGLKEGSYYPKITSKYGDAITLKVVVAAPELRLNEDEIDLGVGQSIIISAEEINEKLVTLYRNNDKISVQKISNTSFQITGLKTGTAIAGARDSKNQYDSVLVNVKQGTVKKTEDTNGEIRYIRDWANGSNRNRNSHWIEIQAFDSHGTNIAEGKTVTTKNTDYSHRPMSRVTDNNLTGGNYAEGGAGLNYITVDLGKAYDIETVKVWHYYPDGGSGRIYNNTKTEVSSDGVNWTVLHDSAIDGTYIEPKDGSGREYVVRKNKGDESSELEKLLEELFTGYGKHDTVQEDGVEVNFFSLPEKKANYIDIVEDKLTPALERAFDSHGEEKMKEVSKIAKKLIPEYDGNQKIFLEFVTLWIDLKIGEEAFIRGVQDTLTANDMYDIAIQIGGGYSAGKMAGVLMKKMTEKHPKTIGTKLGSKAIPYVGWALGAYTITTATIENADLAQNCASSEDEIDGENTQYYCGKLMVNGILSLGGVAVSKVNIKGAYNSKNKILGRFSGEQKDLINERLSPNFMDESILKKNLENPDTFIKSFKNGKYPNLKKIDTEGFVSGLKSVNGKIKLSNGHTPKSKSFNYVLISDNGDLKLIFGENHSYLSQGKNVQYAGNIKFTSSGNISYIDNGSGHYKPEYNDSNSKKQVLETMKDRFGIELNSSIFKEYKN